MAAIAGAAANAEKEKASIAVSQIRQLPGHALQRLSIDLSCDLLNFVEKYFGVRHQDPRDVNAMIETTTSSIGFSPGSNRIEAIRTINRLRVRYDRIRIDIQNESRQQMARLRNNPFRALDD